MASIELFIWRHAEAEDGVPDLERRLTPAGRKAAARVAKALAAHVRGATMLVSPAARTRETAAPLTEVAGIAATIDPRLAPGAPVANVQAAIDELVDAEGADGTTIIVVGHQPWVGALARRLMAGEDGDWRFRKAAAWWLHRRRGESDEWALRTVFDPDLAA